MMKRIIIVLFVLVIVSTGSQAQIPGYQGKRFILSYNACIIPGLLTYVTQRSESIGVFYHHNLTAEYVLGRKFSIGAELSLYQDKPVLYPHNQNDQPMIDFGYNMIINGTTLGLDFIFYPVENSPLAPVGNYFKLKLFTNNYQADGKTLSWTKADINGNSYPVLTNESAVGQSFGFGLGFGQNHIIYNKIVLNAGLDFDINLDQNVNPNQVANDAFKHIMFANIVYFKIGVGGLLF